MSQAAIHDDTPVDPDDELLVAYLDGELSSREENLLMDRLLSDQELNRRLQLLQEGWDWLDKLPDATPNEKLVESTLELVVADIVKAKPKSGSLWSRYRLPLSLAGVCLAAVLVTFGVAAAIKANDYQQQLHDLAVAESLDAYLYGGDMELMRQLAADPSWSQMIAAAREVGEFAEPDSVNVASTPLAERAEFLETLSLDDRGQLASRWSRFVRLDEETDRRVRQVAASVAKQPDSDSLLRTMQLYAIWRETLPAELRDEIKSTDPKKQREAIETAVERTQSSTLKRTRDRLDDETVERIYFVLRQVLQQRINDGDVETTRMVENLAKMRDKESTEPFAIIGMVSSGFARGPGGSPGPGGRRMSAGPRAPRRDRPAPLNNEELELVYVFLPDNAQDMLGVVSDSSSFDESMVLRNLALRVWAEEAARRKLPWQKEERSLLDNYQSLDDATRERLDLLPSKEMMRQMSRQQPWGPPR